MLPTFQLKAVDAKAMPYGCTYACAAPCCVCAFPASTRTSPDTHPPSLLLLFACCACGALQDVELQSNCCLTCFGLKAVNVQTAGQGGTIMPEVSATFLKSPEKVREAIRLAVKLNKQQGQGNGGYGAPRAPMSAWGAVAPAPKGSGSLMQRLQDMDGLVARGVLSRAEADGLKVWRSVCEHACMCLRRLAASAPQTAERGELKQDMTECSTRAQKKTVPASSHCWKTAPAAGNRPYTALAPLAGT
jgi:hypothetical protein